METARENLETASDQSHLASLYLRTMVEPALLRIRANATPEVALEPSKLLALVLYLACAPGRTVTRDGLIDLLWADLEPDAARKAVRQHLWQLRRRLGADLSIEGDDHLVLRSPLDSDRATFIAASESSNFSRAVELYTGDFFTDFASSGSGEFERWVAGERAELRARFVRCAEVAIRDHLNAHRSREALTLARRVRSMEPFRQHGWRLLLESLLSATDYLTAAIECDALERMGAEEGFQLEPATRSLITTIRRVGVPSLSASSSSPMRTELVGREREFAALTDAWERAKAGHAVSVVIEGGAGLGKTRLLMEFRARLQSVLARTVAISGNAGASVISFGLASDIAGKLGALPGARSVSPHAFRILVGLCPSLSSVLDTPPHVSAPADMARHRLSAMRELIEAVAADRPVAILIDDLHWSDHDSRALISGLHGSLSESRVLICVATRPTAEADLEASITRLALAPLTELAVLSLVSSVALLPADPWTERFVQSVMQRSRGIPLYVIELLQLGLQEGAVELRDGEWRPAKLERLWKLLESGEFLKRRMASLTPSERRALQVLSVASASLPVDAVLKLTSDDKPAGRQAVVALAHNGLVVAADNSIRVSHDEIAALVTSELSPDECREISRGIGARLAELPEAESGLLRRAAAHSRMAGDTASLQRLLMRYVSDARRHGDHRPIRNLAAELLGTTFESQEAVKLARTVPASRRSQLWRTGGLIAAGTAGLGIGLAAAALRPSDPPGAAGPLLTVEVVDSSGHFRIFEMPLTAESLHVRRPLTIAPSARPVFESLNLSWRRVRPEPGGARWLAESYANDSGAAEIFLVGPNQPDRRMTFTKGDDVNPDWSPDSRSMVFATGRWDEAGRTDIAVMAIADGTTRQLTSGPTSDSDPKWSPDGSRIAFRRRSRSEPKALCVMHADGARVMCTPEGDNKALAGWRDDTTVVLGGTPSVLIHAGADSVHAAAQIAAHVHSIGAGNRFATIVCGDRSATSSYCLADNAASGAVRLLEREAGEIVGASVQMPAAHLEQLVVRNAAQRAPVGEPFFFDVAGTMANGQLRPAHAVRLTSLDPAVAVVDSAGFLTGLQPGLARIVVTNGGWRKDTVSIAVSAAATVASRFEEDWEGGISRWKVFGDPPPIIEAGESIGRAFMVGGDGVFHSGAVSRMAFDVSQAIAVEFRVSAPVTQSYWQTLTVTLLSVPDWSWLDAWDGRSDYLWASGRAAMLCALSIPPRTEAPGSADSIQLETLRGSLTFRAPRALRAGEWMNGALFLTPDGRCGASLDGVEFGRSLPARILADSAHVAIFGNSVGTRLRVGAIRVRSGSGPSAPR